jgi:hypothetical protein
MFPSSRSILQRIPLIGLIVIAGVGLVSCGPTSNQPAAPVSPYDRAKTAFKSGDLEKTLDLTDKLASATPPDDSTDRARVLRAVIYTGELKGTMELSEAYGKGAERAKNPRFQSEYRRLHNDNLSNAAKAALNLAETAHQIAPDGAIAKELTLDANYPTAEGPGDIKELARVVEGGWVEPEQQESASTAALRKGIDDALADAVSGDRAKARQALAGGSTKLPGTDFAIFLAKELADGAVAFDRHHGRDTLKLKTLCDEGDDCLKAALALLKDTPNKDQDKEVKKLQDKFKTLRADK